MAELAEALVSGTEATHVIDEPCTSSVSAPAAATVRADIRRLPSAFRCEPSGDGALPPRARCVSSTSGSPIAHEAFRAKPTKHGLSHGSHRGAGAGRHRPLGRRADGVKLMKIDARVSEVLVRPSLAASPIPNRHRGRDAGTPRDAPRSTRDSNPLPCPDAARVVEAARDARRHGMMTAATTLSRASSVVGVGAGATSRRPVDRAVSAVATSSSYSRRARRVATVRAASSRTSSSATTTTTTTTRSALAMETPSTTTTDADDDDDKTGVVPSLRELRAAIPAECFVPCLRESMKYAAIDLGPRRVLRSVVSARGG